MVGGGFEFKGVLFFLIIYMEVILHGSRIIQGKINWEIIVGPWQF